MALPILDPNAPEFTRRFVNLADPRLGAQALPQRAQSGIAVLELLEFHARGFVQHIVVAIALRFGFFVDRDIVLDEVMLIIERHL